MRAASKGAHGVCLDAIHRYTVYTVLDVAIPCRAQLKSHHFLNIDIICCFSSDFLLGLCVRMYWSVEHQTVSCPFKPSQCYTWTLCCPPIMQNSFAVYVGKRISGVWFVDRMWIGKVKITHCSIFHGCLVQNGRTALDAFHRPLFVFLGAEVTLPLFTLNFPEIGQPMQVAPPAPGTDWWSLDMFGLCWCLLPLC